MSHAHCILLFHVNIEAVLSPLFSSWSRSCLAFLRRVVRSPPATYSNTTKIPRIGSVNSPAPKKATILGCLRRIIMPTSNCCNILTVTLFTLSSSSSSLSSLSASNIPKSSMGVGNIFLTATSKLRYLAKWTAPKPPRPISYLYSISSFCINQPSNSSLMAFLCRVAAILLFRLV